MPKPFVPDYERKTIPLLPMIAISFVSFLDNFCYTLVNPNIPYMCKIYYPDLDDSELGFYSGWITAAYSLGGIPGNFFWGWFADRYGRRWSICLSICGVIISMNIFGLADNFALAFVSRALWGFLNGNLGIAKTYISEICNDYTQTFGFSIFQTVGGFSSIVGPAVGGFLSKPEENLSALTKQFPILRDYRYYIPCFAGSIICLIVFIVVLFMLPETLSKEDVKQNIELMKQSKEGLKRLQEKRLKDPKYQPTEEEMTQEILSKGNYLQLITTKPIFMSVLLYGLLSLVQGGHDALYPVWMINSKEKKGFEWTQTEVGYLYSWLGPVQMISGPLLNNIAAKLWTCKQIWLYSGWGYLFSILLAPLSVYTIYLPEWTHWFVTYIIYGFSYITRILQFTAVIVMITNVSYPDFRGKVNGIGQVFASAGRFVGPTIATNVYAWSLANGLSFPFDFNCIFIVLSVIQIAQTYLVYFLDDSANHSTPSIRMYVKRVMKERGVEMKSIENEKMEKGNEVESPAVVAQGMSQVKGDVIEGNEKGDVIEVSEKSDIIGVSEKGDVIGVSEKSDIIGVSEKSDIIEGNEKNDIIQTNESVIINLPTPENIPQSQ